MKKNLYPAILLLTDGHIYKGWSFKKQSTISGEMVFNTGMTGYQEIITDPSYIGQIVVFTYPEIGNTGINNEDYESHRIQVKGIIAKNICIYPNNWRKNSSLCEYLIANNIPHIFGIDTRKLAKHIRAKGVMEGYISNKSLKFNDLITNIQRNKNINDYNKIQEITTDQGYKIWSNENYSRYFRYTNKANHLFNYRIIIIDLGVKTNIISRLLEYKCKVFVLPATSSADFILQHQPDGILVSNGPGNPANIKSTIKTIKTIIQDTNLPIFGICMGHQIISLALGYKTFKLKFGHRGLNHPSGNAQTSEITSQNHGFAVKLISNSKLDIKITHLNLNDFTIAGLLHKKKPIFSVQYHPEASPGPHDSEYLFNNFLHIIQLVKYSYPFKYIKNSTYYE